MKNLLKTKTFWSAMAGILTGIGIIIDGDDVPSGIQLIITSVSVIFLRDSIRKG